MDSPCPSARAPRGAGGSGEPAPAAGRGEPAASGLWTFVLPSQPQNAVPPSWACHSCLGMTDPDAGFVSESDRMGASTVRPLSTTPPCG